ncbi:toxin glutamine deamidase domain-containing protein [Couchioplanes azureus]|uniref:toxin glutamine deamidase domain-containing protein n=1 Tax=Couchioplanes caeruleus TaxID=56438 RepID=UPI001670F398|nr:toxin glutamine deamidase domain-containing protein [Couchioplanes caeruleus]GGQ45489.1 hypothetical protein GCM10010166_12600 [Couchioplanes caeruleus subsp. azureus]
MTVLPSPIPHPLDYCPFDVPGWAYEALEWVVGFDWPEGDEKATWDVADRWYAIAGLLAGSRDEAHEAAARVIAGFGAGPGAALSGAGPGGAAFSPSSAAFSGAGPGSGTLPGAGPGGAGGVAQAFIGAWGRVAVGEGTPLEGLVQVADELGRLVEECGCDIEAAKLEAWIEIGLFLIELIGMSVAVALTLGAASPAAGGLIAATRLAIQQIFRRLVERLGSKEVKKTLEETAERAATELTTREGLRRLGREGVAEGLDEMREELATNAGIQLYQNTTGRADGLDYRDMSASAAGGFAGGFAASGAGIGRGSRTGTTRGTGAEVLGELGVAAVNGDLPDLEDLAKSASSGAAGTATESVGPALTESLQARTADLAPPPLTPLSTTDPPDSPHPVDSTTPPSHASPPNSPPAHASLPNSPPAHASLPNSPPAHSSTSSPSPSPSSSSPSSPSLRPPATASPYPLTSAMASPPPPTTTPSPPPPSAPPPSAPPPSAPPSPGPPTSTPSPSLPPPSTPPPSGPPISTPSPPLFSDPSAPPLTSSSSSPSLTQSSPLEALPEGSLRADPSTSAPAQGRPGGSPAAEETGGSLARDRTDGSARSGSSGLLPSPTESGAAFSREVVTPKRPVVPGGTFDEEPGSGPVTFSNRAVPVPEKTEAPTVTSPVPSPEASHYLEFARLQRAAYAEFRRQDAIDALGRKAESARRRARHARWSAKVARFVKFDSGLAQFFQADALAAGMDADRAEKRLGDLRNARPPAVGSVTTVEPQDWHRANRDSGRLAPGGISVGNRSTLTGSDHPPPIDATRRYGERAGLRPPLARHQLDLENAVPRDAGGDPVRAADPRTPYFRLINDGGPAADPTRAINCQDCVLSFFDTYMHGRPRVSAPRTFDAYQDGDPQRPQYGEELGCERIERATGGRLQSVCPPVDPHDPAAARHQVEQALVAVSAQLVAGGHGSFAFLISAWEGGAAHAWAAVNQNGRILFVDPQSGLTAPPGTSLYGHHGAPHPGNVTAIDALVVNGGGVPMPFPSHPDGLWRPGRTSLQPAPVHQPPATHGNPAPPGPERQPTPATPTPAPDPSPLTSPPTEPRIPAPRRPVDPATDVRDPVPRPSPTGTPDPTARAAEHKLLASLTPSQRQALQHALGEAQAVAETELTRMHTLAAEVGGQVVDEQHRVKSLPSLARKFAKREATRATGIDRFLRTSNDRVRFSIQIQEDGYVETLHRILSNLDSQGYQIHEIASFWGDGRGRHNGLNITMTNPDGFRMELQIPTEQSRRVGKLTHELYEIVRIDSEDITGIERVEAFLAILAINKMCGMTAHQPASLDAVDAIVPVDTSLVRWATRSAGREPWIEYRRALASDSMTFHEALHHWTLVPQDIPGIERLEPADERADLRIPSIPRVSELQRGDEPHRLPEPGDGTAQGSDVARGEEEVDIRPRSGGGSPVRRFIRRRVDACRPGRSGEAGARAAAHRASESGAPGSDV